MVAPVAVRGRDLRALAAIVSEDRLDLADGEGLPPSLLADLMSQIRCDCVALSGIDSARQEKWVSQGIPPDEDEQVTASTYWKHYWDCEISSYPDRSGDLRSVIKPSDFYSVRQWHSTGMYTEYYRPYSAEHLLGLVLPAGPRLTPGPGQTVRLVFFRGPGPEFSERDRALLTLLRPHLYQAYLDAQRRRHPVPRLTPRQNDLLRLLASGRTNTQIARQLGISEGTVRTHLENIYTRLNVSSRTAAVTRVSPDRFA
jgi:DNA-binding CsgD family transcriptional regulator